MWPRVMTMQSAVMRWEGLAALAMLATPEMGSYVVNDIVMLTS